LENARLTAVITACTGLNTFDEWLFNGNSRKRQQVFSLIFGLFYEKH